MAFEEEDVPYIGQWAELKKNYLMEEKPEDYAELIEEHWLIDYLASIEAAYSERFDKMVEEQMAREGVNEELKSKNPLEWVGRVNNIRSCVKEILIADLCDE